MLMGATAAVHSYPQAARTSGCQDGRGALNSMIHCEGLVKIYKSDDLEVVALQGSEPEVREGEMMAIIGNSGSGKSTLLNILGRA